MSKRSLTEEAVDYEGDLAVAANEVVAELDDTDGVVIGSKEYKVLIKQKAREHRVLRRDLEVRVLEIL